jgi:hypothetical protein
VAAAQKSSHGEGQHAGKACTTAGLFHFPLGGHPESTSNQGFQG